MFVGLTGTISSGKGAVTDILKGYGYSYFSLSSEVREEAQQRGIPLTRENLQNLGNELRQTYGTSVLAARVAYKLSAKNYSAAVIDGIRNPAEITELRKLPHFTLVAIDAPQELRFQRVLARNRESDPKTFEEFLKVDNRDQGMYEHASGQQVRKCIEMADLSIMNDRSLEQLTETVHAVLKKLGAFQ